MAKLVEVFLCVCGGFFGLSFGVCLFLLGFFVPPVNRHGHSDVELSAVSYLLEITLICNRTLRGSISFLQRISVLSAVVTVCLWYNTMFCDLVRF